MRLLLMILLLTACGKDDSGGSSSTPEPWTDQQDEDTYWTCIDAALDAKAITGKQALSYCGCVVDVIKVRWGYDDYVAKEAEYTETLKKDGTVAACKKEAGIE